MQIRTSSKKELNQIDSILTSNFKIEQLSEAKTQLKKEFEEIGDNRIIFIASIKNENIAMVQLILKNADNNPELANGIEICHVHNLQVHNVYQSQGIGRKMMEHVEEYAQLLGKKVITLGVDGDNYRAIKMYKNREYIVFKTEEGRTPEELLYLMRKNL